MSSKPNLSIWSPHGSPYVDYAYPRYPRLTVSTHMWPSHTMNIHCVLKWFSLCNYRIYTNHFKQYFYIVFQHLRLPYKSIENFLLRNSIILIIRSSDCKGTNKYCKKNLEQHNQIIGQLLTVTIPRSHLFQQNFQFLSGMKVSDKTIATASITDSPNKNFNLKNSR